MRRCCPPTHGRPSRTDAQPQALPKPPQGGHPPLRSGPLHRGPGLRFPGGSSRPGVVHHQRVNRTTDSSHPAPWLRTLKVRACHTTALSALVGPVTGPVPRGCLTGSSRPATGPGRANLAGCEAGRILGRDRSPAEPISLAVQPDQVIGMAKRPSSGTCGSAPGALW